MPSFDTTWTLNRTIASEPDICAKIMQKLIEALQQRGWQDREVFGLHMAMEEAILNAIRHGNQCAPDKTVDVQITINNGTFEATITDQGPGFDLADVPDPTDDENLEQSSGRGLALIQNYADEVAYNETGNSLTIKKRKP